MTLQKGGLTHPRLIQTRRRGGGEVNCHTEAWCPCLVLSLCATYPPTFQCLVTEFLVGLVSHVLNFVLAFKNPVFSVRTVVEHDCFWKKKRAAKPSYKGRKNNNNSGRKCELACCSVWQVCASISKLTSFVSKYTEVNSKPDEVDDADNMARHHVAVYEPTFSLGCSWNLKTTV